MSSTLVSLSLVVVLVAGSAQTHTINNKVINCWAKSKEADAASKAEEMLVAMGRLHASGIPNVKADAFTYTAVIDVSWIKVVMRMFL